MNGLRHGDGNGEIISQEHCIEQMGTISMENGQMMNMEKVFQILNKGVYNYKNGDRYEGDLEGYIKHGNGINFNIIKQEFYIRITVMISMVNG